MKNSPFRSQPRGFTLVELLVVIAIIGVFVAMLFPALQAARESGRRSTCQTHLMQLLIATHQYQAAHDRLPAGTINPAGPIKSEASGYHHNWLAALLPNLDEQNVYRHIDFSAGVYDERNAAARNLRISTFVCPSDAGSLGAVSSYAGCHHHVEAPIDVDNQGVLFLNSRIADSDVTDGTAHTIFLGEKIIEPGDLGWMSGTSATLRNTGQPIGTALNRRQLADGKGVPAETAGEDSLTHVGGFASYHPGVALFGFGDGSVLVLSDEIDMKLFRQLGNRSDGELTNDASLR